VGKIGFEDDFGQRDEVKEAIRWGCPPPCIPPQTTSLSQGGGGEGGGGVRKEEEEEEGEGGLARYQKKVL
jgi:hypothetical protein